MVGAVCLFSLLFHVSTVLHWDLVVFPITRIRIEQNVEISIKKLAMETCKYGKTSQILLEAFDALMR